MENTVLVSLIQFDMVALSPGCFHSSIVFGCKLDHSEALVTKL